VTAARRKWTADLVAIGFSVLGAVLAVMSIAVANAATDADCRAIIPKAGAACVATGNLCSSQYGACCSGYCGLTSGGCRCVASTTTPTTPTATTSTPTTTRPSTTISTGCQIDGKQVTAQLPRCCSGLAPAPKAGTSGLYCPSAATPSSTVATTTRPASTTTTTLRTAACSVRTAGKACNEQALCCPPLLCIPNPSGSDSCGTVTGSTPTTPSPPSFPVVACRPNGIDLSARWANGSWLNYANMSGVPHVASNAERDCMENALKDRLVELIELAGDLAPNAANKARDCRTLVQTRIGIVSPYEGALQATNGAVWFVPSFGRHYQCEQLALEAFRNELTSSSKRALAAARFANLTDLQNLLDVDPTFTGRASFPTKSVPAYSSTRAAAFQVDTRTRLAPCGNRDCSRLHATHEAHACVTRAKCGDGVQAACPIVGLAHTAYENGCGADERCMAFRKMKPFHGTEDTTRWTRTQLCQLAKLQDREHLLWMAAQEAGDWAASRKHDANHDALHEAANDGDDRNHYTYSCDAAASDIGDCFGGDQPMSSLLLKLVDAYGIR
jgi:hypothetical protein